MKTQQLLAAAAILALLVLVTFADLPGGTLLWRELQNACHAPAFGLLAVACLALTRHFVILKSRHALLSYLIALIVAVGLGFFTELVQHFAGRDAEYGDVMRDALGALAFLCLVLSGDPAFPPRISQHVPLYKISLRLLSVILLSISFASLGICATAYVQRESAFPTVVDLSSAWSRQFAELEHSRLEAASPSYWRGDSVSDSFVQLVLAPAEYPGVTVEEPHSDWTGYSKLRFDLFLVDSLDVRMGLRIDDVHHNYNWDDRFSESLDLHRGWNQISVDLESVRTAPAKRETDMRSIRRIILFAHDPGKTITLILSPFRLE